MLRFVTSNLWIFKYMSFLSCANWDSWNSLYILGDRFCVFRWETRNSYRPTDV